MRHGGEEDAEGPSYPIAVPTEFADSAPTDQSPGGWQPGVATQIAGWAPSVLQLIGRDHRPIDQAEMKALLSVVETEVVPRLLEHADHEQADHQRDGDRNSSVSDIHSLCQVRGLDVDVITDLLLAHDGKKASAYILDLMTRGISAEALFLDLLAAVARRLGDMWETDATDFTTITEAVGQLSYLMHMVASQKRASAPAASFEARALLIAPPSERHIFGLHMVAELLLLRGWSVTVVCGEEKCEIIRRVTNYPYILVGFTVGGMQTTRWVQDIIPALRTASRVDRLSIFVGGHVFNQSPALASDLDVDFVASSGEQAVAAAEELLKFRSERAAL